MNNESNGVHRQLGQACAYSPLLVLITSPAASILPNCTLTTASLREAAAAISDGPLVLGLTGSSTARIFLRVSDLWTSAALPLIAHRHVALSKVTACSASSISRPRTYKTVPCDVPARMMGVSTQPAMPSVPLMVSSRSSASFLR